MDQYDSYCAQLRERVEELRPILLKIQSREALVEDRIELERLQLNPDRLKNRSANAFAERKREETMLKGVRSLEKLTTELIQMIETWESKHGEFEYSKVRYLDRISKQEETYHQIKESLRNTRTKRQNSKVESTPVKTDFGRKVVGTAPHHSSATPKGKEGNAIVTGTAIYYSASAAKSSALSNSISKISARLEFPAKKSSGGDTIENRVNNEDKDDNASVASDDSGYSSMTEVRERESTVTVVRPPEYSNKL